MATATPAPTTTVYDGLGGDEMLAVPVDTLKSRFFVLGLQRFRRQEGRGAILAFHHGKLSLHHRHERCCD